MTTRRFTFWRKQAGPLSRPARNLSRLRPSVERLEDRCVPASAVYSWTGTDTAIPDALQTSGGDNLPQTAEFRLSVPDHVRIADLDVTLNVRHDYTGDLGFVLIAPDGRRVRLVGEQESQKDFSFTPLDTSTNPLSAGQWFVGAGGQGRELRATNLDDEAVLSLSEGASPLTGNYKPAMPLSAFDGLDARGEWALKVTDYHAGSTGDLLSWSLKITPEQPAAGVIEGHVQYDPNSDGVLDPSDPPAQGITVYLDTNANGCRDPGETSTQTDATGYYRFDALPVSGGPLGGNYLVALDIPAPDRITTSTRLTDAQTLFHADFETGLDGFTVPATPFGAGVNLWHPSLSHGEHSIYFGAEGQGNHYSSNSTGDLISPVIDLTGQQGPISLEFRHWLSAEISYDTATVGVLANGKEFILASNEAEVGQLFNPTNGFETAGLDLSAFAGQKIQVFFRFTANGRNNDEGWYISDVAVRSQGLPSKVVPLTAAFSDASVNWGLSSPVADLVGVNFSSDQSRARWGDPVTVHYTIRNQGDGSAGPFNVSVRLADSDWNLSTGTVLGSFTVTGLTGHAETTGSLAVTLPATGIPLPSGGQAVIGLVIDDGQQIAESDETNNVAHGPLVDYDTLTVLTTVAEQSSNDTLDRAQPVSGPGRILGELTAGDVDYYRLDLAGSQRLQVTLAGTDGAVLRPRVALLDGSGQEMLRSDAGTSGVASLLQFLPAGQYYLRVSNQRPSSTGLYALDIDLTPASDPQSGTPAGANPRSVRLVDVNGDGKTDAVVAAAGSREIQVLLGNGDGSFQPGRSYPVEATLASAEVADITGDGIPDLIGVLPFNNAVAILPGTGNGTFGTAVWTSVGSLPQYAAVVDDPGPGPVYLVTANRNSHDVSVLRAGEGGKVVEVSRIAVGDSPMGIFALDVSGDGLLDVVVANSGSDTVTVLFGDRSAPFQRQGSVKVTTPDRPTASPFGIAVADVDGDGQVDLLTANFAAGTVSVLTSSRGYLDAYLDPSKFLEFRVGLGPYAIRLADVNHDGRLDIITANSQSDDVSVLLADPQGVWGERLPPNSITRPAHFLPQQRYAAGTGFEPQSVDVADVNNDGWPDIVTANWMSNDLSVLLNNGDGTFLTRARAVSSIVLDKVLLKDVNSDGISDLVTLNPATTASMADDVSVLLGNGDGSFQPEQRYTIPATESSFAFLPTEDQGIFIEDVNGDGRPDLIVTGGRQTGLSVLLGNGDGSFQTARTFAKARSASEGSGSASLAGASGFHPGQRLGQVWVADVNGDGRVDVLAADALDTSIHVLLGRPAGAFGLDELLPIDLGARPVSLLVADVDGDGNRDVVATIDVTNEVVVLYGPFTVSAGMGGRTVSGDFQMVTGEVGTMPRGVSILPDQNGDGRPELVMVNQGSNDLAVLKSDPSNPRGFLPAERYPVGTNPLSLAVASAASDLNGDGLPDLISVNVGSGDLSILLGQPGGTFAPQIIQPVGRNPRSLAVTQLNGDKIPDLVVARDGGDIEVLLGKGDGTFIPSSAEQGLEVRTAPRIADLDGDGKRDVVALDRSGQILFRKGLDPDNLVFAPPVVINPGRPASDMTVIRTPQGLRIASVDRSGSAVAIYSMASRKPIWVLQTSHRGQRIASADLNGDGLDDLVITHPLDGVVTIALQSTPATRQSPITNHQSPRFVDVRTVFTGVTPADIAFSDVNGDGRVDILANNRSSGILTVLFNSPDLSFTDVARYRTGTAPSGTQTFQGTLQTRSWEQPVSLLVGQFLGSSRDDILVVERGTQALTALEATGDGLANPTEVASLQSADGTVGLRPGTAVTGDFNSDGLDDVAVLVEDLGEIWVYLAGAKAGTFRQPVRIPAGNNPTGLTAGDVNASGKLDLVVSNGFGDVLLLLGDGAGGFKPFTRIEQDSPFALVDLDGDGQKDVIVASSGSDQARAFLRRGNGFIPAPERFSQNTGALQGPGSVQVADLNKDGLADLIITNSGGNTVLVFPGVPGGFSTQPQSFQVGTNPVSVLVLNLDNDGYLDLAVADQGSNDVAILFSTPGRETLFTAGPRLQTHGTGPLEVRAQDVTGPKGIPDGVVDLLVKHGSTLVTTVLAGLGNGFFDDREPEFLPVAAPSGAAPQQPGLTPEGSIFYFDSTAGGYVDLKVPAGPAPTAVTAFGDGLLVARLDGSLSLLSADGTHEIDLAVSLPDSPSALEVLQTSTPGLYELYATGGGVLQPTVLMLDLRPEVSDAHSLTLVLQTAIAGAEVSGFGQGLRAETDTATNSPDSLLTGPLLQVGRRQGVDGGDAAEEEEEGGGGAEGAAEMDSKDEASRERFEESVDEALRELGFTLPKQQTMPAEEEDDPGSEETLFEEFWSVPSEEVQSAECRVQNEDSRAEEARSDASALCTLHSEFCIPEAATESENVQRSEEQGPTYGPALPEKHSIWELVCQGLLGSAVLFSGMWSEQSLNHRDTETQRRQRGAKS